MAKGPFKLKSGNSPSFKKVGATPAKDMKTGSYAHKFEDDSKDTPAYLKEFGIGKGTSPYRKIEGRDLANMFMAGINNVYGKPGETTSSDALTKSEAENEALREQLTIAQRIIKGEKIG